MTDTVARSMRIASLLDHPEVKGDPHKAYLLEAQLHPRSEPTPFVDDEADESITLHTFTLVGDEADASAQA